MQVFQTINEWSLYRSTINHSNTIGFVPTMGAIHKGHLSLVKKSLKQNNITIVSIFVNPTQFNNEDDLKEYPIDYKNDQRLLKNIGVDVILLPNTEEIYADEYKFMISENSLSQIMEGKYRKNHFNGMLTIVMKLINIVKPTITYFGEKDHQQFLLIQDMILSFFMDTKLVLCPTIRQEDGLAYSSRNTLLSNEQRVIAPYFFKILQTVRPINKIKKNLIHSGFDVDYIEKYNGRCYGAVKLGNIRLIDNVKL